MTGVFWLNKKKAVNKHELLVLFCKYVIFVNIYSYYTETKMHKILQSFILSY